jgi:hypothetical protein
MLFWENAGLIAPLASSATALIAMMSAIFASRSSSAARKSAHASEETYRANLFMDFSHRYNSEDMYLALKLLTDYYKRNRKDFLARWMTDRMNGDPEVEALGFALRTVGRYYLDVARLYDNKLVSGELARAMCGQRGINVFYKIWLPMSKVSKPEFVSEDRCIAVLKKIRKSYDDGEIV